MKYKLIRTDTYNSLLRCVDKALQNNHELRKVCQCRQCKYSITFQTTEETGSVCKNPKSNNFRDTMNPFSSCEKCERR